MNFLTALKIAIQLLAVLPEIITTIQKVFPNSAGSDKLSIAKTMIQSVVDSVPGIEASFEAVWKIAEPMIKAIVALYKVDGTIAPKA